MSITERWETFLLTPWTKQRYATRWWWEKKIKSMTGKLRWHDPTARNEDCPLCVSSSWWWRQLSLSSIHGFFRDSTSSISYVYQNHSAAFSSYLYMSSVTTSKAKAPRALLSVYYLLFLLPPFIFLLLLLLISPTPSSISSTSSASPSSSSSSSSSQFIRRHHRSLFVVIVIISGLSNGVPSLPHIRVQLSAVHSQPEGVRALSECSFEEDSAKNAGEGESGRALEDGLVKGSLDGHLELSVFYGL